MTYERWTACKRTRLYADLTGIHEPAGLSHFIYVLGWPVRLHTAENRGLVADCWAMGVCSALGWHGLFSASLVRSIAVAKRWPRKMTVLRFTDNCSPIRTSDFSVGGR